VVATRVCWIEYRCSLKASARVFHPRMLRGRELMVAATALMGFGAGRGQVRGVVNGRSVSSVFATAALVSSIRCHERCRHVVARRSQWGLRSLWID